MARIRQAAPELVHPFLMGCATKQPKLVQASLVPIQRLISHSVIDSVREMFVRKTASRRTVDELAGV